MRTDKIYIKKLKEELKLKKKERDNLMLNNDAKINIIGYFGFGESSSELEYFQSKIKPYNDAIDSIILKIREYETTKRLERTRIIIVIEDCTFYYSKEDEYFDECDYRYNFIFNDAENIKNKIHLNDISGDVVYFYVEKTKNKLSEKIINKEEEVYKFININELFYNDLIYIRDNNIKIEFNEDDAFFNIRDGYFKFIFNEEYYKLLEY